MAVEVNAFEEQAPVGLKELREAASALRIFGSAAKVWIKLDDAVATALKAAELIDQQNNIIGKLTQQQRALEADYTKLRNEKQLLEAEIIRVRQDTQREIVEQKNLLVAETRRKQEALREELQRDKDDFDKWLDAKRTLQTSLERDIEELQHMKVMLNNDIVEFKEKLGILNVGN